MDDIAVVGIGLRFPGDATSPEELWKVLERGESQWSEFPKDRLNIDGYYHPGGDRQGSISFRGAHFLKGSFASFDASFFSVAAEDAKAIDPQQRILLEASYEALENVAAGIRKEDIDGSDTAVYVGSFVKDYEQVCLRDPDWQPQYAATGNGIAIMANRISYFFNLHGPSMTIDTGCSGSLVSVHLAAQSLRVGECSLAIAAGAGMILAPNTIMPMTALNFLSPDGKCFTFDARANGYGRGEGIGVVILKRLSDALRDNDTIRAVIRGTKVNQDGHTTGITLPSKEAQVANINSIYESVGLDFNQTAYVECHGTGTQAGDWRELKAISESLASVRAVDNPILVGSIKPNIGHLEGAAGVAGLIKGVLTLEHGKIPPNINFDKGNPDIDFEGWKVKVPSQMLDWPLPGLRRVSVNCFGFGGTNAHVIMDEAPRYLSARGLKGNHNSLEVNKLASEGELSTKHYSSSFEPQLFCFSSHEKSGVRRIIESHLPYLISQQDASIDFLRDYAYTLGSRRSALEWKHAVTAKSRDDLVQKLQSVDESEVLRTSKKREPRICFVFCGQGAQFAQMGKDLLPFEAFRDSLEAASRYMRETLGSPFNLLAEILKDVTQSHISDPRIAQPATTTIQIALVDLFDSFHITPKYVVGHSSGEVAAAFASGALTREAAWEVAYYRGVVASSITLKVPELQGAMMVVGLSLLEVKAHFKVSSYVCEIACINSPRSTTLSGKRECIERAFSDFSAKNIFCRVLPVKLAYHSSHMLLVENEYKAALGLVTPRKHLKTVTMFSSVTGKHIDGCDLNKKYWASNLVSPVHYFAAMQSMMNLPTDERPDTILELSPTSVLRSPTLDIISSVGLKSLPSYHSALDRKLHGTISLLKTIGELWCRGYPISMKKVVSRGSYQVPLKCLADLPPYPWNHAKSYWHESHLGQANRFREFPRQDLIGAPTADAISFEPRWRGFLRVSENPWIQDHQVQKTIIYPAAGMATMALEGIQQLTKDKGNLLGYEITDLRIGRAMIIPSTGHGLEMAMNFKPTSPVSLDQKNRNFFEFSIYSKQLNAPWEQHATGFIQVRYKQGDWKALFRQHQKLFELFQTTCKESVVPRQLYELLDIVGMNYGTLFQNITQISKGANACISKVRVPDTKSKMPAKFEYNHLIHPATLDSIFQTLFAIDSEPMVPTFIKRLFVSSNTSRDRGSEFTGYATASRTGIRDADADIAMAQSGWKLPSVIVSGLHFTGISSPSPGTGGFLPNNRTLCTQFTWQEDSAFAKTGQLELFAMLHAYKYPGLSVLQVGGSWLTARGIMDTFFHAKGQRPWLSRYTVAQVHPHENTLDILSHVKGTSMEPFVEKRSVDGSEPLPEYQLIIVCTQESVDTAGLLSRLKPSGCLLECYRPVNGEPVQAEVLRYTHTQDGRTTEMRFRVRRQPSPQDAMAISDLIILLPNQPQPEAQSLAGNLIIHRGPSLSIRTMQLSEVKDEPERLKGKVIISLLDFSVSGSMDASVFSWDETEFHAFHVLQKHAKGIIWVCRSANMTVHNPRGAPILALARAVVSEDPLKTIVTLDLSRETSLKSMTLVKNIFFVFYQTFSVNHGSASRELEYAERQGKLFIPRLVPIHQLNEIVENGASNELAKVPFHAFRRHLKLQILRPGLGEGGMIFSAGTTFGPKAGEVEIMYERAPINHVDLETVMGRTVDSEIGSDICGRVGRVGRNVSGLMVGDRVSGLTVGGSIQSNANIDCRFVRKWSSDLPLSQCVSAYHSLIKVGRLGRGRSTLIHAGASSFGLAAVIVATYHSVEVFATVMGTASCRQRTVLESLGVKKDHILEADSDSFTRIVRDRTGGKGVDLVYNSTQNHLETNFHCVRSGKFSLTSIPHYVAELLDEIVKLAEGAEVEFTIDNDLVKNVQLSNLRGAFGLVQKSPHLGFVSAIADPKTSPEVEIATAKPIKSLHQALFRDATYVLAGGLGGLGRSICNLLINNGVKHVAFLSRSGASSEASRCFVENLKKKGVNVQVYQVDICDAKALQKVVKERISIEMPVIKGVFQCAAVIKDAVFDNMTYSDWVTAVRPKTIGSQNLMDIISASCIDPFFIFLASSAGVIGNRGQANYAAGNCFEDALALNYRLQGKHAVSIDLGPVLGAGMLAEDEEILDMLRASGFYGIRHQDFLTVVTHAITMEIAPGVPMPPRVIMGIGTGGLIRQNQPADPYWSRTSPYGYLNLVDMPPPNLTVVDDSANVDMRSKLGCCTDMDSAAEIVTTGLSHMLAKAMNMLPEEIDTGKPPNVYGVDSLVAVGVRNWVVTNCGVEVSVFEVLSDKTIGELAMEIATKGGFGLKKN
ncbi:polyketide synthase [Fusarium albosuccineum]|uniref:Polyketide synthase n=1 Tax=Fusarium albosuccineum TaxID=1237068 RepID=A0A8H4P9B8_9HYPO|nr:polyketide synthase [Fusarium albosuccineum]